VIELTEAEDGRVTVDMGAPVFDRRRCPSTPPASRRCRAAGRRAVALWPLDPIGWAGTGQSAIIQ
jgi:hypothetical protein